MTHDHNSTDTAGQTGIDTETERRNHENETGQQASQSEETPTDSTETETDTGTGFVGSDGDQSSDYLTKGENQDFAPEGQGASDTNAGTSDIETGQPTSADATLDDGADTSR